MIIIYTTEVILSSLDGQLAPTGVQREGRVLARDTLCLITERTILDVAGVQIATV